MRKFRHARRLRGELMSEINITPFVDVLLVLLVSFLISAPLMTLALPIQLPKGKLKERAPDYENSILAVVNKKNQISIAKKTALNMYESGYTKPIKQNNIKVLGKQALGMLFVGVDSMLTGKYISEHDKKIAQKIAHVLCGGELSQATHVTEDYLLELEREAFLSLCSERKTLERIQSLLQTGKILRN